MIQKTKGGTLLSQTYQVCGRVFNRILRAHNMEDLEGARGRVIFALWNTEGVPITALCEKTSLDKSTLTGILNRLERDGYISRRPDESDKRKSLIFLTGKEKHFENRITAVSSEMNEIFYAGFTDEEILQFDDLLQRILTNCKKAEAR